MSSLAHLSKIKWNPSRNYQNQPTKYNFRTLNSVRPLNIKTFQCTHIQKSFDNFQIFARNFAIKRTSKGNFGNAKAASNSNVEEESNSTDDRSLKASSRGGYFGRRPFDDEEDEDEVRDQKLYLET
jgi:hypothetical protein